MRILTMLIAGVLLAGCAAADNNLGDAERRCAELAEARAAEFLDEETYALEQRTVGPPEESEVQRQLLELDARAYREEVYQDCLRRAGRADGKGEAD